MPTPCRSLARTSRQCSILVFLGPHKRLLASSPAPPRSGENSLRNTTGAVSFHGYAVWPPRGGGHFPTPHRPHLRATPGVLCGLLGWHSCLQQVLGRTPTTPAKGPDGPPTSRATSQPKKEPPGDLQAQVPRACGRPRTNHATTREDNGRPRFPDTAYPATTASVSRDDRVL